MEEAEPVMMQQVERQTPVAVVAEQEMVQILLELQAAPAALVWLS